MDRNFTNRKDLLIELVRTNFKLRYNNSVLGFIWVLLKPLLTFVVLYFVFSYFKGGWVENYQVYLLLGIILYTFFNEGIVYGMNGILDTAHIILKVNFPREIALAASLVMALINFVINIVVLGVFIVFNPISPTILSSLYFLLIVIILFILIYGISLFTSIIIVKLRDLAHVTELAMQLLFYATPIFYPIDILPDNFKVLVKLNPLTILIQSARDALIDGSVENVGKIGVLFLVSLTIFFTGHIYFKSKVKKVAEDF